MSKRGNHHGKAEHRERKYELKSGKKDKPTDLVCCNKCGQPDMFLTAADFGPEFQMKTPADYVCADCRPKPKTEAELAAGKTDCEICGGTGTLTCDMDHEHECGECEGTGEGPTDEN